MLLCAQTRMFARNARLDTQASIARMVRFVFVLFCSGFHVLIIHDFCHFHRCLLFQL